MADKRIAYAGDLTSDVLGKKIAGTTSRGQVVRGEVAAVSHKVDESGKWPCLHLATGELAFFTETNVIEVLS